MREEYDIKELAKALLSLAVHCYCIVPFYTDTQGQIQDFWKGGHMYKGVGFDLLC